MACQKVPLISAFAEGQPYPCRVLLTTRWRAVVLALAVTALAVIGVGGYRVYQHFRPVSLAPAGLVIEEAASSAGAVSSASATFTTQVNGLTVMFGTVSERVTPTRLATLSMTSVDGVERIPVTEVVTRSDVFVSMPSMVAAIGKPWLKVPVPELGADPAMAQLYQTGALPTAEAALVSAASTVQLAGTTTVRGVPVSRYVGSINPATALDGLDAKLRPLLAAQLAATTGTIHFTAWIDSQHSLRKVQTSAIIGGQLTVTTVVVIATNRVLHIAVPNTSQVAGVPIADARAG